MFGCRHAPLALPPEIERALAAAYAEPHRAYHTAAHIAEVLWFTGKREEARKFFEESRKLDSENRSLQRALEKTGA